MNFREIAQEVYSLSGLQGSLDSVVGQSGIKKVVVDVTRDAWVQIQRASKDWTFRRGITSFSTVADKITYTPSEVMVGSPNREDDLSYYLFLTRNGELLTKYPIEYLMVNTNENRVPPAWYVVDDSTRNIIMSRPDGVYQIDVMFYKAVQELQLDEDVPYIPEEFHYVIVDKALELLASDAILGNTGLAQEAYANYNKGLMELKRVFIREKRVIPANIMI